MLVCRCAECVDDKFGGEKLGAFFTVVGGAMVFGPVVSFFCGSGTPVIFEMFLVFAVAEPPIVHVHGFGSSGENVVGDNAKGSAIVSLDGSRWLLVSHFLEESATWDGFVSIDV